MSFIQFLIEAKINTYASDGKVIASSRPNSKDLYYSKGQFEYIDSYVGEINFIGQEVVYEKEKAIWGMNYYGEMLGEEFPNDFSKCLKDALKRVPVEAPYRGPESYAYNDLVYTCQSVGNIESFKGTEEISYQGKIIYRLYFHGGSLRFF